MSLNQNIPNLSFQNNTQFRNTENINKCKISLEMRVGLERKYETLVEAKVFRVDWTISLKTNIKV